MASDAPRPLQFASPEWVDRVEAILTGLVEGYRSAGRLEGVNVTFSQTFHNVPPNGTTTHWGVVLSPEGIRFVHGPIESDLGIVADYDAVLPIAHFVFGDATPRQLDEIYAYWQTRRETGEIVDIGDLTQAAAVVRTIVQTLHDRQAVEIA